MRDAKKRTRSIRSRRINVSKPLSLNGKKPMRGLLGSLIGDPKRFRAVIARLVDPQSRNGAGEAHQQDARSYYGDQVD